MPLGRPVNLFEAQLFKRAYVPVKARKAMAPAQFADPVNRKYPIHDKRHAASAAAYFARPRNQAFYSQAEQAAIWRLIQAAQQRFASQPVPKTAGPAATWRAVSKKGDDCMEFGLIKLAASLLSKQADRFTFHGNLPSKPASKIQPSKLRRLYAYPPPKNDSLARLLDDRPEIADAIRTGGYGGPTGGATRVHRLLRRHNGTVSDLKYLGKGSYSQAYRIGDQDKVLQIGLRDWPAEQLAKAHPVKASRYINPTLEEVKAGELRARVMPRLETQRIKPSRAAVKYLRQQLLREGLVFSDAKRANVGYDMVRKRPLVLDAGAVISAEAASLAKKNWRKFRFGLRA